MKKLIPIFILLLNCSSPSKEEHVEEIPPRIQHDKAGQIIESCDEFFVTLSNETSLLKTSHYFANGRIASEHHHLNSTWTRKGKQIFYDYNDTLLVQRRSYVNDGDSLKSLFYYDNNGFLVKEEHFDFKKRIREDADKGLGSSEGCIIMEDDYKKERSWKKRSIMYVKYDSIGRIIEKYAPTIHWNSQNRYTWSYNSNNKIVEHRSYDHDQLIWVENFSYSTNSYEITRTWFDHEGNPKHLKKGYEYSPKLTFTYTLNTSGRVINKMIYNENNVLRSQETTEYDIEGRVTETNQLNNMGQHLTTHLFRY